MLIFVSDLHLVDSPHRASLDVDSFVEEVKACMSQAGSERCTLVLLGDIFELLKSDAWVGTDLRPWSPPNPALVGLVGSILEGVYKRNQSFFDAVNHFCTNCGLQLAYIPGNHDGLMFSASMGPVREALRRYLPGLVAPDPQQAFLSSRSDDQHGTYAEHGHEFDTFNRLQGGSRRVVPGDVVVVEILAHLPVEVAKELGSTDPLVDQFSPELAFLQDLDDVLPQDGPTLTAWIEHGLVKLAPDRRDLVEAAICTALGRCLRRAAQAVGVDADAAGRYGVFAAGVSAAIGKGRLRAARLAARLVPGSVSELPDVVRVAMRLSPAVYASGASSIHMVVAGHTHIPVHHPVMLPNGQVTYLNSGTWRRVLLHQPDTAGEHAFAEYVEATVTCVWERAGGDRPRYDYRRRTFQS